MQISWLISLFYAPTAALVNDTIGKYFYQTSIHLIPLLLSSGFNYLISIAYYCVILIGAPGMTKLNLPCIGEYFSFYQQTLFSLRKKGMENFVGEW